MSSVPLPRTVAPSLSVTVPVGVPRAEVTVARKVHTVQAIAPPPGMTATATSPTTVMVSWLVSSGAASYEIARRSSDAAFAIIGSSATTSFNDTTAAPNTAYLYIVRTVDGAGGLSIDSNADRATTLIFTDDPLVARTTVIKAAYLTELRTAVQAVRGLVGLSPASFTEATIDNHGHDQSKPHLRAADGLGAARSSLALPALTYTDSTLSAGATIIKAAYFQELRLGVN